MPTIKIQIHLFASLEAKAGQSRWAEDVEEGTNLDAVWDFLKRKFGFQQQSEHILMAINGNFASKETVVKNGDEISFFPPVGGG